MESEHSGQLEEQVRALTQRVGEMERALRAHGILEMPGERVTSAVAESAAMPPEPAVTAATLSRNVQESVSPLRSAAPSHEFEAKAVREETPSLEARIGSQWFNRLGILAILIGAAWFLKFAFDNHWIGPLGRILIGLVSGSGLIAWSERFRSRGFAVFSYSLKAVGSGTLYLSLWAAFSVYSVIPASAAFAAMIAVTAFNGFVAWKQEAELLALYAIAGGISTPLLVSTGQNREVALFSYLLILDAAVLVLAALRPWSRLLFAAFVGTCFLVLGWAMEFYTQAQAGRTAVFITCSFLLFAFAPWLVRMRSETDPTRWEQLAVVVLPLMNALLGFVAFYSLLSPQASEWAPSWIAVAFAAFYLGINRLPARGVLRTGNPLISALHLATAMVFLTIAIPLKTHGRWLTIGWLAEGVTMLWMASRMRSALLRVLALLCLCLGLAALLTVNPAAGTAPIFNQRFGTYAFAIAAFGAVARIARRSGVPEEQEHAGGWATLAGVALLVITLLILVGVGWEIHSFWWYRGWHGQWAEMHEYQMYAQFSYSAFFMLFGAALLTAGFWRRSPLLRWQALVLLAVSIGKVFVFDVSELSRGFRILSFLGLGALLLGVSFVYQRDWLGLREKGNEPS